MFYRYLATILPSTFISASCATYFQDQRQNVLIPEKEPQVTIMDFSRPIATNPMEPGWYQYKFNRKQRSLHQIRFTKKAGKNVAELKSDNSIARLYREVDIPLEDYQTLSWDWMIETPIALKKVSEKLRDGDDHPARIHLSLITENGEHRELELIWGNELTKPEFFSVEGLPHYVVRGGSQTNQWFSEAVNVWELYKQLWPDDGTARITDIGISADSDQTKQKTLSFIANLKVIRKN